MLKVALLMWCVRISSFSAVCPAYFSEMWMHSPKIPCSCPNNLLFLPWKGATHTRIVWCVAHVICKKSPRIHCIAKMSRFVPPTNIWAKVAVETTDSCSALDQRCSPITWARWLEVEQAATMQEMIFKQIRRNCRSSAYAEESIEHTYSKSDIKQTDLLTRALTN